ncbi:MAG: WYL domain-containing protein [Ignavibacteria bacterium]|nr:WYL domain-containing protein [Ignavibacteria bacterium]
MLEQLTKFKRQIEILGLCSEPRRCYTIADLAEMYQCEDLTIKRDLHELRTVGIDIHSDRRAGVRLATQLDMKRVKEVISQYLSLAASDSAVDKATAVMVKRLRGTALTLVVTLQRSIDCRTIAVIDYEKEAGDIEKERAICPLLLFETDGQWRVLAVHDGRIKQYHLNKILSASATPKTFQRIPQEQIDAMFEFSFRSWIGPDRHHVRIRLSPMWARRIKPNQMMESQVLIEHPDGSVDFETTVNSLDELASWIVSRGEGVVVLDPPALREKVISIAEGALGNYLI